MSKILNSREARTEMRLKLAKQSLASISLSFNVPGSEKTNSDISRAFDYTVSMLNNFLLANRILLNHKNHQRLIDAAGDFYLVPIAETIYDIETVKSICEDFENQHALNRIIDVDVVDNNGNPISSGKAKKCFICNKAAITCMRNQNHKLQDLTNYVNNKINKFLHVSNLDYLKNKLSAFATQALLFEISLSPKPGLVDKFGTGSHKDMDFFSFLSSSSAFAAYWAKIIELAFNNVQENHKDELIQIRVIGIEMEQSMLEFTHGVNTHKGAIFIIGMLVYSVSKLFFSNKELSDDNIKNEIILLNKDNMSDKLLELKQHNANGKIVRQKYGNNLGGGIRREMALGLPIVFNYALPVLRNAHKENKEFINSEKTANKVLTTCLLTIMGKNNDSNILHRANKEILLEMQQRAKDCLTNTETFEHNYKKLCYFCTENNISPGGSADLLSAAIFIYQVTNKGISLNKKS